MKGSIFRMSSFLRELLQLLEQNAYYSSKPMENSSSISNKIKIQQWVESYADDLYRWAFHKTNQKEVAEDLVQETFLAAFSSLDSFQEKSKPKTWLFSILNHKVLDYHRKHYQKTQTTPFEKTFLETFYNAQGSWKSDKQSNPTHWHSVEEHLFDDPEFNRIFDLCMQDLPDRWFSVLQLKYLQQKKGKEICQELEITPTNFWQLLHRAKVQLKRCLEKYWFQEE